jgi:hypothetical protein
MSNLHASLSGKGRSGYRSAAAKLHDECHKFMDAIRARSHGTNKSIVDGAQVLVTSSKGDMRGEIVHVDDDFACIDYVDEKDRTIDMVRLINGGFTELTATIDKVHQAYGNTLSVTSLLNKMKKDKSDGGHPNLNL